MNELRLLEEIRNDFVSKFDNDPQVKRICNVMINEFKARSKALTLTDVGCSLPRPLEAWNEAQKLDVADYIDWHLEKEKSGN